MDLDFGLPDEEMEHYLRVWYRNGRARRLKLYRLILESNERGLILDHGSVQSDKGKLMILFMATVLEGIERARGIRFKKDELNGAFDCYSLLWVAAEADLKGELEFGS